jgi:hypothetical protein
MLRKQAKAVSKITTLMLFAATLPLAAQNPASVRILLGIGDTEPVRWDGTITPSGGSITSINGWRFEGSDGISGSVWHCSTHTARLFGGTSPVFSKVNNIVVNGIVVSFTGDASFKVTTAQGDFEFSLSELAYGKPTARLSGRVWIDRIPPTTVKYGYPTSSSITTRRTTNCARRWMQGPRTSANGNLRLVATRFSSGNKRVAYGANRFPLPPRGWMCSAPQLR